MPIVKRQVAKIYKDISLSFDINPVTQDIISIYNKAAISNALKNIVLIGLGEVPFDPTMGSDVGNSLFELSSTLPTDYIATRVRNAIELNEPRVEVRNVEVEPLDDENTFNIDVSYLVTGDPTIFNFTFILEPSNFS